MPRMNIQPPRIGSGEHLLHRASTERIRGAFYDVYNDLGFGFLEAIHARALTMDLRSTGAHVEREVTTEVRYRGAVLAHHRMDLVVDKRIVVEIKATKRLHDEDSRQLLNYLRATEFEVGLLLHFGPRPSFRRLVSTNSVRSAGVSLPR